jgi:hypothetical protein
MKKFLVALLALTGWATAADAQVQYPQTLPPNVVWGRTGISAGPGQAIPFSLLGANLFISQPAHSVILGEGGGNPIGSVAPGTAGLPFVSNGASADPSYQALTNAGTNFGVAGSPLYGALGSFYTTTNDADGNANARIHAFRDRVFVDDGVLCSGAAGANPNFCLSSSRSGTAINNIQWGWAANGSSLLAINSWGAYAITGYTVASNAGRSGNPYPPSSSSAAIGVSGFALNDYVTTPFTTWAGYFETIRQQSGVGSAVGIEIDVGNVGSTTRVDPYTGIGGSTAQTVGNTIACGGSAIGPTYTECSAGLFIAPNTQPFQRGIVFFSTGLDTTLGIGGGGIALSMPTGADLQWEYAANTVGMDITSTNNTTTAASLLNFNNGGATLSNSGAQFQPQWTLINTHAGTDNAYFVTQKQHGAGVAIANGDSIGTFLVQGFANAAYQSSGSLAWTAGTPSGSNVPSTAQLTTSTSGGQLNNILTFDLNAHLSFTQPTAPTLTAGCNGAGSSVSGTDVSGTVTGQTAAATTCTLTFGTAFGAAPHCAPVGYSAPLTGAATPATGTLVVNFPSTANFKWGYICVGA